MIAVFLRGQFFAVVTECDGGTAAQRWVIESSETAIWDIWASGDGRHFGRSASAFPVFRSDWRADPAW